MRERPAWSVLSFVALVVALVLPAPASALTAAEIVCRHEIAAAITGYSAAVSKVVVGCHQRRSKGKRPLADACNEVDQADAKGALVQRRDDVRTRILEACNGQESLFDGYVGCPAPAATADDGGATGGIDDFAEVGDCLIALADARGGALSQDAQGNPSGLLLDPLRKCQGKIGKGSARIVRTYLQERGRCQKAKDQAGGSPAYGCDGDDARGRIAKAGARFAATAAKACNFSPEVLGQLDACDDDRDGLVACARASADLHGAALIRSAYELDGGTSTTTTTMPGGTTTTTTTTTTLPPNACGTTFPQCDGACPSGFVCESGGSDCSCVEDGSGPCAPATIRRIIHGKYGAIPSDTALSTGWSGSAHDVEIPDLTGDVVDVTCDANCENCEVSMNVQAGNPASNCRCTSNPSQTCTVINGSDAASCGSLDPTCRCYFGSPLPLSSGGTPACVVNRIRQDYSGTMNLRTGEWNDSIRLAAVVYLGLSTTAPCPTCNGDPTPNDGVRGGTCSGGLGGGACDANGVHATFGATSWDCLPASAANISGAGLLINLESSTGPQSMEATLPCDTPSGQDCPCRVCSGNGNLGCSSDADCAAGAAGVCTSGGGAGVVLNQCDGFACGADGKCVTGPVDTYCDGIVHPDGRGFIPCNGDNDCTSNSAGTCSVVDIRRCFPDPIVTSGDPDRSAPVNSALFCIAPTSNPAVNLAAGLPGPGELSIDFTSDIRCQNDPDLVYEFPSGDNCGFGGSTTTTTLLPLPDCVESDSPVCGGVCPSGQVCTDNAGACECTGIPLPTCDETTAPTCGGVCENLTDVCADNGGTCECTPLTLPQCTSADAPLCGGLCPTGELCQDVGGVCECGSAGVPSCASSLSPLCGGICDPGFACIDMGGSCGCQSLGLPTCGQATTPLCAGTCALGSLCQEVFGACQCVIVPLP